MPETDDLIPTSEAAVIVGDSVRQFIRRVERGEIEPAKKLPGLRGAYLFDRVDVASLTPVDDAPSPTSPVGDGAEKAVA